MLNQGVFVDDRDVGRAFPACVPILALGGSLAAKARAAPSAGTFPTHRPLFVGLLVGVIIIVVF
jgi:K+-transporting ATPase ATPase A chain